jgi:hypothetical protein
MIKVYFFFESLLILIVFNLIESSLKFYLPTQKDKCFQVELYFEGTILVRYDLSVFDKDFKENQQKELFKNTKIFIKNGNGKNIYETELKSRKDKFAVFLKEPGVYQVCTRYIKQRRESYLPNNISMGLKIRSDYQYTDIDQSLHKSDVNNFWRRIREIKNEMRPSLEASKNELSEEDKTAKSMIHTIDTYHKLCYVQFALIIISVIYNIGYYKDYFKEISLI